VKSDVGIAVIVLCAVMLVNLVVLVVRFVRKLSRERRQS